jgi:phage terminase large subunit-like protein
MEFLFHVTGIYPAWYPEAKRHEGPIIGRIVGKDFSKAIGEVIIPFLEENLDESLIAKNGKKRNPQGIPIKWILKNGSVFDILSYEMDSESFEGWRGHVAWFDEPPPRDKYIATLRGLVDYRGRHWLTLTPLTQPWIYDEIFLKTDNKVIFTEVIDMDDNPYLTAEAKKEFADKLTNEEKEARLHGRFLHLTGLIYKEFDQSIHICEPPHVRENWSKYFCIDPHVRTPTACLWLAVDPQGNHWVYDELWLENMDLEQIAHMIHAQEGTLPPLLRFIDPAMDKDDMLAGGFNTRKELAKYGIFCQRANTDTDLGKQRIRQALKPKYSAILKTEVPQLRISRFCKETIHEFQHYIYSERKHNKEEFEDRNTPRKKDDHFMDCLRYIYNYGPTFVLQDEEGDEIRYEGTYAKYPTKAPEKGSYHSLVER